MRVLKQQLRSQLRLRRNQLSSEQQSRFAQQITNLLFRSSFAKNAQQIALYLPFDGEVPTFDILKTALDQHKTCYAPVIDSRSLRFVKIDSTTSMVKNRFGILEPNYPFMKLTAAKALDLVLVPLVAFDEECYRLGMGAGFYDTTFAFRRSRSKPPLIGLAYDFQKVFSVPRTKSDIKLDCVVTEKRLYLPPTLKTKDLTSSKC